MLRPTLPVLLATALAAAGAGAGVAAVGPGHGTDRAQAADVAWQSSSGQSSRSHVEITWPDPLGRISVNGNDVITVKGTKCPKSHPHQVGTSSTGSWTQINGGRVEHSSSRRLYCAR